MFQKKRKALDNFQTAAAAASATSVPTLSAAGFLNPLVTTASYLPISDTTKAMMKEFPKKSTEYILKQYDPGYAAFMGYNKDEWNRNLKQKIEKMPTSSSLGKVLANKDLRKSITSYLGKSDTCAALCAKMPGTFVFKNTQTGEVKNCVKECATTENMKEYIVQVRAPMYVVVNLKIKKVKTNYDGQKEIVFESHSKNAAELFDQAEENVRDERLSGFHEMGVSEMENLIIDYSSLTQTFSDWVNDNCELRFFRSGKPINYDLLPSELFDVNYQWDEDDETHEYFTITFTSK